MKLNAKQQNVLIFGLPILFLIALLAWHQDGQVPVDPPLDPDCEPVVVDPVDPNKPPTKLVVLILRERKTEANLPQPLKSAFDSKRLRDKLKEVCYTVGGQPGFRILDNDSTVEEQAIWTEAMKKYGSKGTNPIPDSAMPYFFISDGKKSGIEGSIPHNYDADSLIALLNKEAGIK